MITLGRRSFAGPFLAPLWTPPRAAAQLGGLYAVMVPGWRLLTFRAIYFGQTGDFASGFLKQHTRYDEWLRIAGTDWNLYIATHEMAFATASRRGSAAKSLAREYRPEFTRPAGTQESPALGPMLPAPALRAQEE